MTKKERRRRVLPIVTVPKKRNLPPGSHHRSVGAFPENELNPHAAEQAIALAAQGERWWLFETKKAGAQRGVGASLRNSPCSSKFRRVASQRMGAAAIPSRQGTPLSLHRAAAARAAGQDGSARRGGRDQRPCDGRLNFARLHLRWTRPGTIRL